MDAFWRVCPTGLRTHVAKLIRSAALQRVHRILSTCVAVGVLAACNLVSPNEERVIGFVDPSGSPTWPPIVLPDTALASEPLLITVWTLGGGCTRKGDTEMVVSPSSITVTPYDIVTRADACLASEEHFLHQVNVELTGPGPVQILLRARDIHGGVLVELQREVWAR